MATSIDIADAVVASINDRAWAKEFVAVRDLHPSLKLEEATTPRVSVLPREQDSEAASRGARQLGVTIDVLVIAASPKGTPTNQHAAEWIDVVEQIDDHFHRLGAGGCRVGGAKLNGSRIRPLYDREKIEDSKLFASVLSLSFVTVRRV